VQAGQECERRRRIADRNVGGGGRWSRRGCECAHGDGRLSRYTNGHRVATTGVAQPSAVAVPAVPPTDEAGDAVPVNVTMTLRTGKGRMDHETILDYRYFVEPAAPHCTRCWARILPSAALAYRQVDRYLNGENDNGRRSQQLPDSEARPRREAVRESVDNIRAAGNSDDRPGRTTHPTSRPAFQRHPRRNDDGQPAR
jgi:hypothetical protein